MVKGVGERPIESILTSNGWRGDENLGWMDIVGGRVERLKEKVPPSLSYLHCGVALKTSNNQCKFEDTEDRVGVLCTHWYVGHENTFLFRFSNKHETISCGASKQRASLTQKPKLKAHTIRRGVITLHAMLNIVR